MGWSFLDFTGLSHFFGKLPEKMVTTDTTQTISGTKSFSSTILGSVSGSAASAAKDGVGNVIADTYETKADAATHLSKSDAAGTYLSKTDAASAYVQTAAVDQTIAGTKTFSKPIAGSVTGSSGSCTGNAATATKATQDAAGNTITTTYATKAENNTKANDSDVVHKSGDETIAGTKTFSDNVHASGFHATATNALMAQCGGYTLLLRNDGHDTYLLMSDKDGAPGSFNSARPLRINNPTGVCDINGNSATATTATTAEACTGNAATATKLAAKRTIALSGAATGTATAFDGSGNITIPVTALAASAIRAQWYAAYPDGAEAHNAMWGGRDITDAFNNGTVSAKIANGTFRDIFPGDYITKQVTIPRVLADDGTTVLIAGGTYNVNWVIADCDYWINKGDTAMETHHVVIVPQEPILYARMNGTNTTEGGYAGSEMYKKIIPACATGIVNAFGSDHILTFRDGITTIVNTSLISSNNPYWTGASVWWGEWRSVQCNLMCEAMVYDGVRTASSASDNITATRQMSAFRLSEKLINYNRQGWWLRDVVSSVNFAGVVGVGFAGAGYASDAHGGVRPFALLI